MSDLNSYQTAARFRDIMRRTAKTEYSIAAPQALVGRVVAIDISKLQATVWLPGDEAPIQVNIFATAIPGDWQSRHQDDGTEETSLSGHGSLVVVERFRGQMYVTQVLTGGSFSFGSRAMNQYVVTQLPQVGDAASTELTGESFELYTAAEVIGTIDDGDAVAFGPFKSTNPLQNFLGLMDITVQIGDSAVKRYRFAANPLWDSKLWFNNGFGISPLWFRILPEQEVINRDHDEPHVDFDLEIGVFAGYNFVMPSGNTYTVGKSFTDYMLWFRLIKRGDWGDLAAKLSIRTTAFQLTVGAAGIFGNENLPGPLITSGYLGFDGESTSGYIPRVYDGMWQTNFHTSVTSNWEISGTRPWYEWPAAGSTQQWTPVVGQETAFSVVPPEGRITMAATGTEYTIKKGGVTSRNTAAVSGIVVIKQVSTVATVVQRVKALYDDQITASVTDDDSVNAQFDWGLSGVMTPRISWRQGGVFANLAAGSTLSYAANDEFKFIFSLSKNIWRLKVWKTTDPEPDDFNVTYTNTGATPQPTFPTIAFSGQRNTGNTNSNAVVAFKELRSHLSENYDDIVQTRQGIHWRPGPWRSGLLRMANDLQKCMTLTGGFTFDGTFLGWTGEIIISGIGRNRNGLTSGSIHLGPPGKYQGFVDEDNGSSDVAWVFPQGEARYATNAGFRLNPGEALYVGIPPGIPDIDIAGYYLFIVDSTNSSQEYQLPEWALLIAARSVEADAPLRFGTGQVGHSHLPQSGENGAFLASFTSVTSATFAITFETPFRVAPQVQVNIDSGAGATARWISRAINMTTTGFTAFLFHAEGTAGTWTNIQVSWTASEHGL